MKKHKKGWLNKYFGGTFLIMTKKRPILPRRKWLKLPPRDFCVGNSWGKMEQKGEF